jgi:hypothetical protein
MPAKKKGDDEDEGLDEITKLMARLNSSERENHRLQEELRAREEELAALKKAQEDQISSTRMQTILRAIKEGNIKQEVFDDVVKLGFVDSAVGKNRQLKVISLFQELWEQVTGEKKVLDEEAWEMVVGYLRRLVTKRGVKLSDDEIKEILTNE